MQAIVTRYLPPTETLGARMKATAQAGSLTIPYSYDHEMVKNHQLAALALAKKLNWACEWNSGWLPNGDEVHTIVTSWTSWSSTPQPTQ